MGDRAVLMAAGAVVAGVAALASLVCAGPLTLARMGLTVPQQLAAQNNVDNVDQLTKRQCSTLIEQWKVA